ncbi:9480_t:CDS:2, partial [Dentiscutata erythropus]
YKIARRIMGKCTRCPGTKCQLVLGHIYKNQALKIIGDQIALSSIQKLPHLQTFFTGAWTSYEFHEYRFMIYIRLRNN